MDLKKKFKQYGWTSAKVAEALKITPASLSQQVNNGMTVKRLEEIAKVINIPASELLAEDDVPPSNTLTCPHCGKPIKIALIKE